MSGRAHREDRIYQEFCRDALRKLDPELVPYSGDGIDVSFPVGGTTWTIDVVLANSSGGLVVECRRQQGPIKQEAIAAFAYKVELLRRELRKEVAGIFFARRMVQVGAVKVSSFEGISFAVCEQDQPTDAFSFVYHQYDGVREQRMQKGIAYLSRGITASGSVSFEVTRASDVRKHSEPAPVREAVEHEQESSSPLRRAAEECDFETEFRPTPKLTAC